MSKSIKDQTISVSTQQEALKTLEDNKQNQTTSTTVAASQTSIEHDTHRRSKEDDFNLQDCQKEMREFYLDVMSKVPLLEWVPGDTKDMKSIFVDPVCALETKDSDEKLENVLERDFLLKNEDLVKRDKELKNEDLINIETNEGQISKRVLVVGKGGTGKSIISANLAYKWAQNTPNSSLSKFSLVVVIIMRKIQGNNASLEDIIFEQILPEDSKVSKESLKSYIKSHPEEVLVVLDGIDEDSSGTIRNKSGDIRKILENRKLRNSCVILTTRSEGMNDLRSCVTHFTRVKLHGFSTMKIHQYIEKYFRRDKAKGTKLLNMLNDNPKTMSLATTPILLLMICLLWETDCSLPKTMTQLYRKTVRHLWNVYKSKEGQEPPSDEESDDEKLGDELNKLIHQLGKVALQNFDMQIDGYKNTFNRNDFESEVLELAHRVNILSKETSKSELSKKTSVTFLHATLTEYCAGVYLSSLIDTDHAECEQMLQKLVLVIDSETLRIAKGTLHFCCGTKSNATRFLLEYMVKVMKPKGMGIINPHLRHIYESQLSYKQCQEFVSLYSRLDRIKLIINEDYIPCVQYLFDLFESSQQGLFPMLTEIQINTSITPLLQSIVKHATNLNRVTVYIDRQFCEVSDNGESYLTLFYQAVSSISSLKHLGLLSTIIQKCDATPLIQMLTKNKVKLEELILMHFQLDPNAVAHFLRTNNFITRVSLANSDGLQSVDEIFQVLPYLSKMYYLSLIGYRVSSGVIKHLRSVVSQLAHLRLRCCGLNETHLLELVAFLSKAQKLTTLDLSHNLFPASSFVSLARYLEKIPQLAKLCLVNTGLEDEGACELAKCLISKPTLRTLELDKNWIGPIGKRELCLVYLLIFIRSHPGYPTCNEEDI
ncbi:NACHT, LRR and PYD domains-containing protein 3-like [Amphiura filiformis]|uniref:NACHT, LRR and PYD domains-containing protein 3-like n=1 Tax=Amphiura filiformis TaxID=82378 RepID=UPI003B20CC78